MTRPIRDLGLPLAAALLVLGGCGGDDSSDDASATDDGGTTSEPSGGDRTTSHDCVGAHSGKLTLTSGKDTSLPGGSTAALDSTDFDAEPPTATLELGEATAIERKNATDLAVGDQFGLQRAVYKVVGICGDEVVLDEF